MCKLGHLSFNQYAVEILMLSFMVLVFILNIQLYFGMADGK